MTDHPDDPRVIGLFALAEGEPEGNPPRTWIQVMIAGKFKHPKYGQFTITPTDLEAYATDIQERGEQILIDFDHASATGDTKAAGWYTGQTRIGTDGLGRHALFAEVEFTPAGATAVRSKEYRFISPEFSRTYRDETGKLVKKVRMWATALTNRPFLPDMAAVTLSDMGVRDLTPDPEPTNDEGDTTMDAAVLKLLGLPEDADEKALLEAITNLNEKATKSDDLQEQVTKLSGQAELDDEGLKKLIADAQKGVTAAKELHDMKRDTLLAKAVEDGKILPVQKESLANLFDLDPEGITKYLDATPAKSFSEIGSGETGEKDDTDVKSLRARFESEEADDIDEDSLRLHAKAESILKEKGKLPGQYTADEYMTAVAEARAA